MNKTIIYSLLLAVCCMTACDPLEDRQGMGGSITADQLNITATPIVVNGKKSNKIVLENHSPVLSSWDYGLGISNKSYDEILLVLAGESKIKFTGLNPDGTKITKELTVNVEELSFEVPKEWELLCGDGSKEWVWDDTQEATDKGPFVWGNGGYKNNTAPAWWRVGLDEINDRAANEGPGASLTFTTSGAKLIKKRSNGTAITGSFSFDMSKKTLNDEGKVWGKGKLYTKNVIVLCGVVDEVNIVEYDILVLDKDKLVLSCEQASEKGTGYFWMFKAK